MRRPLPIRLARTLTPAGWLATSVLVASVSLAVSLTLGYLP